SVSAPGSHPPPHDHEPQAPDPKGSPGKEATLAHGVSQYPGASGVLQLDGKNKYPPDKAVFIREIAQPSGITATLLSCGVLPDRQNPAKWGTPPDTFPCPKDDTAVTSP
ncbi:hypothetical protein AB0N07_17920, partial [Streptomyces sp. NPDC051172]|uniref:hypothetical protein n=1 Tax=Streptomyces sp. NPDC051172 TaxID=3155796 RepID=UPI003434744C